MIQRISSSGWRARIEIYIWRHGWWMPVAVLLTIASVIVLILVARPTRNQLMELRVASDPISSRWNDKLSMENSPFPRKDDALKETERIASIQTTLRTSGNVSDALKRMLAVSDSLQLPIPQTEYQTRSLETIGIRRIQFVQLIQSTYPKLKQYVDVVLAENPNISLDQFVVKREHVGQDDVQARIQWSIWVLEAERNFPIQRKLTKDGL